MSKGLVHTIMLTGIALIIVGLVFTILVSMPFWGYDTKLEATLIANSISMDISVLSISSGGIITKNFDRSWDVEIKRNNIIVSKGKTKSKSVKIKTDIAIQNIKLTDINKLTLKKDGNGILITGEKNA